MGIARSPQDERALLEETLRGEEPELAVMGLPQLEGYITLAVLAHADEADEARSRILSLGKRGYLVSQSDELLYWPPGCSNPEPIAGLEDTYKVHGSQLGFIVGILRVTDLDDPMDEMGCS